MVNHRASKRQISDRTVTADNITARCGFVRFSFNIHRPYTNTTDMLATIQSSTR